MMEGLGGATRIKGCGAGGYGAIAVLLGLRELDVRDSVCRRRQHSTQRRASRM